MDNHAPGFIQTLIGSLYNFNHYSDYAKRSVWSALGHYLVIIALACSLYAAIANQVMLRTVGPMVDTFVDSIPRVVVSDGQVSVDVEQPYTFTIEGETIGVIDTESDPRQYLDNHEAILVLSQDHFWVKEQSGEIRAIPLEGDFEFDSATVAPYVEQGKQWLLPVLFLCAGLWQVGWKMTQVLIVAGLLVAVKSGKLPFADAFKMTIYALGPAMGFGVLVFGLSTLGFSLPGAGLVFWAILVFIPLHASRHLE